MRFFDEFKAFAMRGNVMDLAVAVVIGAAFGKIVSSLVDGIIMPIIGLLLGGVDISGKSFVIGQATVRWGLFLQNIIDFTLIAFSIFIVIKLLSTIHIESKKDLPPDIKLLTEIRDLLKNQHD